AEKVRQHAVHDRGAHLTFDIVADDRQPTVLELSAPFGPRRDEARHAVDEGTAGLQGPSGIPLRGLFRAYGEIGHDDIGLGSRENFGHICFRFARLDDLLVEIFADAVQRRAALNNHTRGFHIGKAARVVWLCEDRLRNVTADLRGADIESGADDDIVDRIAADFGIHDPGYGLVGVHAAVVGQALDEGGSTITDANDPHAQLSL